MPERVVRIILTGDSAGYIEAVERAGAASEVAQSKMDRMQTVGRGMSTLGRTMTMMAAPIVAVGAYSVKTAANFQRSMLLIRTQAGASQAELQNMSKALLNLAPAVGTSTSDLSSGLYHLESAGYRGKTALDALRTAAEGAQIGGANLTDTTTAMTAVMVAGFKGVHTLQGAMGALNATVGAGDMTMQDLNDALSTGLLGTVRQLGLQVNDAGAALAVLGDNNIRGAAAATRLRMGLMQLVKPSAAAQKVLSSLGLAPLQLASDLRKPNGLLVMLEDLRSHLQGLSKVQQTSDLASIFGGGRNSAAMLLLINQMGRLQQKYKDVALGASGFGKAWQETQKNVSFQWAKLKATAQVALIHLGNALMPIVTKYLPPLVNGIKSVIGWFTHLPKPILSVVVAITAFLAIGGPILMFFGSLATNVGAIIGLLGKLGVTVEALPILGELAAIGGAIYLLITHFKQVKKVVSEVFGAMWNVIKTVGHAIGSFFSGLWHGIVSGAKTVFHFLTHDTPLGGLLQAGGKLFSGNFGGALSSLAHGLSFGLLSKGGLVPRYFDVGGPVGTDTVPAWLTPGEFVLNRAATARIGIGPLQALNAGDSLGGGMTIVPGEVTLKVDGRQLAEAVVYYTLKRNARGATSLTGGGLMTGSVTA